MSGNGQQGPKKPDTGVRVYHLQYTDGTIELGLTYVHRAYLNFLADRGGESRFDYAPLSEAQRTHIRELVTELRLIAEHPIIGDRADMVTHRLTDAGRNVVTVIKNEGGP